MGFFLKLCMCLKYIFRAYVKVNVTILVHIIWNAGSQNGLKGLGLNNCADDEEQIGKTS